MSGSTATVGRNACAKESSPRTMAPECFFGHPCMGFLIVLMGGCRSILYSQLVSSALSG